MKNLNHVHVSLEFAIIISENISNISVLLKYTLTLITSYYNVDIQVVHHNPSI